MSGTKSQSTVQEVATRHRQTNKYGLATNNTGQLISNLERTQVYLIAGPTIHSLEVSFIYSFREQKFRIIHKQMRKCKLLNM